MLQSQGIPKIPGMTFGEELFRTNFHKPQLLSSTTGVSDKRSPAQVDTFKLTSTMTRRGAPPPTERMDLDRKVLRFQAYFKEGVHESALEQERIRKCLIYYFLEDDTISVSEPKQDNSGIPGQGTLIKRHQIAQPNSRALYSFDTLAIGQDVTFYGKTFHITDCDAFTRQFYQQVGIDQPEPEALPGDQYTEIRRKVNASMVPRKQKQGDDMDYIGGSSRRSKLTPGEIRSTQQFLQHDREVLRFHCVWDDRHNLYGDLRLFTLQYFLADDTIEVSEVNPPNSGRDPFPAFAKRSKVPKAGSDGKFSNPNTALSFKKDVVEYYTDADLRIGNVLPIYGRQFLIYDCDKFTQDHLRSKFGMEDFTPIDISQPGPPKLASQPPPYNGFGDEEDSLGSWKYLVLKAPRKDVRKYMENSGNSLKFELRLVGGDPSNAVRKFVLTYFLADDTLSIFEPAQRNSGIVGGKFLQRQKVRRCNPDGTATGEYIRPDDLYVGALVTVNTHKFQVVSTDERSLAFMESHPDQFPRADLSQILTKLRAMLLSRRTGLRDAFAAADREGSGRLDYLEFCTIVERLKLPLCEQEILTVMRCFDKDGDGQISWEEFARTILPPGEEGYSAYSGEERDRAWEEIRLQAERDEADEIDRFKASMAGTAQRVKSLQDTSFIQFMEKVNQRRVLCQEAFRVLADNSPDGQIGEAEFRKAVQTRLNMNLPEHALKALCLRLFPQEKKRLPLTEFMRLLR